MIDTETETLLKHALQRSAQTNRRYLYYASLADIEGQNEAAALFRSLAEIETGHAFGLLELLAQTTRDPQCGLDTGNTLDHLKTIVDPKEELMPLDYEAMAKTVKKDGFGKAAEWLETLNKAAKQHTDKAKKLIEKLEKSQDT